MAAKTDGSCLLPTRPAGAARWYLGSAGAVAERQAFGPCGRHPAIASREARFQAGESSAYLTTGSGSGRSSERYPVFCPRRTSILPISLVAPHGDRGRGPGELKVNCPAGAREGGLGRWVLSFSGKYRAAGLTRHRLAPRQRIRTQDYKLKFSNESEKDSFHMKKYWKQAAPGAVGGALHRGTAPAS